MQLSIIIPTYNRKQDLDVCLDSIFIQTKHPDEIIIVDDSTNNEVENLIQKRQEQFKKIGIPLRYIRNTRKKSITISQNLGIKNSIGDLILILDSDVILYNNYIEEILKTYYENPGSIGVQGYIHNTKQFNKLNVILRRIFYQSNLEKNKCRVLIPGGTTYPYKPTQIILCEWLSGCNSLFKREIFNEFQYDEKTRMEDNELPYRIYKKYPGTLLLTPNARLIHTVAKAGRPGKEGTYIKEIEHEYFFYKDIDQTIINRIIFYWGCIGVLIFNYKNLNIKQFISAHMDCLIHHKEIKNGNIDFFIGGY